MEGDSVITLKEIQIKIGENYIAHLEFNIHLNYEVIVIRDKDFTKNVALQFDPGEMNIEDYFIRVLQPCIKSLDEHKGIV